METIRSTKTMNIIYASKIYNILRSTLYNRLRGYTATSEKRDIQHKLILSEEKAFIQYIFDLDVRGFPPRIDKMKDIADLLFATRYVKPTGIQ